MDGDTKANIDMPDTLEEAERFQRLFVLPVVEAVRVEMKSHLAPLSGIADRVTALEGKQAKALLGWGVYATLAAAAIGVGMDWFKRKIGWKSGG